MVNAVTYILDNNATVQSLVGLRDGATTDYKVFPVVVFESEKAPYIVVKQSGKVRTAKSCPPNYTIDVISYAGSYDAVNALNDACVSALEAQTAATVNGFTFSYLNVVNEVDGEYIREHNLYSKIATFEGS
jgi:hypothetical protein